MCFLLKLRRWFFFVFKSGAVCAGLLSFLSVVFIKIAWLLFGFLNTVHFCPHIKTLCLFLLKLSDCLVMFYEKYCDRFFCEGAWAHWFFLNAGVCRLTLKATQFRPGWRGTHFLFLFPIPAV